MATYRLIMQWAEFFKQTAVIAPGSLLGVRQSGLFIVTLGKHVPGERGRCCMRESIYNFFSSPCLFQWLK